jgi:peptide/nickel transport system permease protein
VTQGNTLNEAVEGNAPHVRESRRFLRIFFGRGIVIFGLVFILLFIIVAIFAPFIVPYDPYEASMSEALANPSTHHLLGTDSLGRDTLSRLIYGTRNSLMVGVVAVFASALIGMTMGLMAGYFGGWTSIVIMRVVDSLMSFPQLLLALVIAAVLGGGLFNVMIALGVGMLPPYARLMFGQVLSIKENDYVLAARSVGASNMGIIFRHVVPNCVPSLIVLMTMQIGAAILNEAGLSFLGVGIEPPAASWGLMVNDGRMYLMTNPVLSFAPGLAIMLSVFSFNMVGDGLRDALDPKLRGVI